MVGQGLATALAAAVLVLMGLLGLALGLAVLRRGLRVMRWIVLSILVCIGLVLVSAGGLVALGLLAR